MDLAIKVVVVGNGAVGKSSMIQRYCNGVFTKEYKKTIGVDFLEKTINVDGYSEEVRLMVWDTAGQEEFDAITKSYYRGAHVCVLVFSTVDYASYCAIQRWQEKVQCEVGNIPMVLVQNKMDLLDESVVQPEEAEGLANKLRVRLYRASVKEDLNVTNVFEYLAKKHVENMAIMDELEDIGPQIPAPDIPNNNSSSKKNKNKDKIRLDRTAKKKNKFCF